jgi:RNA polymerase sigma-70 factor (ECF subfamily)
MVGDYGLAEDLVQDVFLRLFQRLGTFRGQCQFTTWLFQIAKNRVLDELRAQTRRPDAPVELTELATRDDPLERNGEIDETVAAIWQAVAKLDLDLKMPLLLRDVAGLSYREIGETLDIPLATVKWRIYTARETIIHAHAKHQISPNVAGAGDVSRHADERLPPKLAPQPT